MGNFGDGDNAKKGKKRGAPNVTNRLEGLGNNARQEGSADYRTVSLSLLCGIVLETTARGGLCSFGLSRDRGAYQITILLDGDKRVIWISGSEDVDAELEKIVHFMAALPLD